MQSTKKNLLGLKSLAGLALRNGCSSFGFRRIGVINPLFQTIFVFKNEIKAMAFYQLLTKVFMVNGASRKFGYAGNTRYYLVLIDLPDLFRFQIKLLMALPNRKHKGRIIIQVQAAPRWPRGFQQGFIAAGAVL